MLRKFHHIDELPGLTFPKLIPRRIAIKNIMFVDNAESVLESLKWIFVDEPYNIFAFDSAPEALEVLGKTEIAVVVVDQSEPGINGIEF